MYTKTCAVKLILFRWVRKIHEVEKEFYQLGFIYKYFGATTLFMEIFVWPSADHNNMWSFHWSILRYDAKWNTLNTFFSDSAWSVLHEFISVWTPRAKGQSCKEHIWIPHCITSLLFFCSATSGSKLKTWSNVSDTWVHGNVLLLSQYWPWPHCTQFTAWDSLHDGIFACVLVKMLTKDYELWRLG